MATKAIDYSNSAVNLFEAQPVGEDGNPRILPGEVVAQQVRLEQLAELNKRQEAAIAELDATPEAQAVKDIQGAITQLKCNIAAGMSEFGYQDLERGFYALYQKRVSDFYSPELVKSHLPKFATALIEEAVNVKALEGLVRGKLVTPEQAESCVDITKRKETLVPIIKA